MSKGLIVSYDDSLEDVTLGFWKRENGKFVITQLIFEATIFNFDNKEDEEVLNNIDSSSEYFMKIEKGDENDYAIKHKFSWEEYRKLEEMDGTELEKLLGLSNEDYKKGNYQNATWLKHKK